jgi:subtilisin family serine protease
VHGTRGSTKISQWCGTTDDASILDAFVTAANMRLDVVSISFGGYLDLSDTQQRVTYYAYQGVVQYARSRGTVIAASAGNEHVRLGAGGRVISHGQLTSAGDPDPAQNWPDLYGHYEVPGGVPGVVDVAATNRTTVPSSSSCPAGSTGTPTATSATCKPTSDAHQAAGQGRNNQLSYYSSYGPRIDIAAPGGARKFNLPVWDRGGTPGFPVTSSDLTNAWETFSITSNWATGIPCYTFTVGSGFPQGQCYSTIQGTSMAAPHVSAAVALMASAHAGLRHRPAALVSRLKATANRSVHNETRALSATDTSPGDLTGARCPLGNCHLSGGRIPDREAYGAGLVNVSRP